MPDTPSFVVNDRRKFTSEGELRHDLPPAEPTTGPQLVHEATSAPEAELAELTDLPEADALGPLQDQPADETEADDQNFPPAPTDEQATEATRAYDATVDHLDTAMRAANPGGDRMPDMTFERLVQSLYTQALMLLGGGAEPGETPRVDILGARQTIDMLSVVENKTRGNLSEPEDKLLQTALFDLRMGFLDITQALARQAAQRQPGGPGSMPPPPGGPRIVR